MGGGRRSAFAGEIPFPGRRADRGRAPPFHPPRAKSHLSGGEGDGGIERERRARQSADTEAGSGVLSRDRWAGRRNPSPLTPLSPTCLLTSPAPLHPPPVLAITINRQHPASPKH